MFKISKLTDYSTVVLSYLAKNPDNIHNARDIMEHTRIALPTVSKILKILAKAGLLKSHRGATGGYSLALKPEEISIARIVEVMEGLVSLTECSHGHSNCSIQSSCHMRSNWQTISDMIQQILNQISLADFTKQLMPLMHYIGAAQFDIKLSS